MLINLLLILLYTLVFLCVLYWFCKRETAQLTFKQASLAFIVKIIFGCFYGWFFLHYYGGDDTWYYQLEALKELQLLRQHPSAFFKKDLFESGYTDNPFVTVFNSNDSFFKDLQQNLLIKLLAIFNLLSGGRYYVNVVLYNSLTFFGSYYFFALITRYYTAKKNLWLLIVFFFPPLVFWTSGIRKDGLCVVFIFGCLYYTAMLISSAKRHLKYAVIAIAFFICLFLIRGFLALSLVPVATAWVIAEKLSIARSIKIYIAVAGSFILLFFLTVFMPVSYNLPQKIADRQLAYTQLKGGSAISLKHLEPTFLSYASVLPQALNNTFLQPYPQYAFTSPLYLLAFMENILVIGLTIAVLLKPVRNWKTIIKQPFTLAMLFLVLINYSAIGFLVPFIGAIIRYKIIFEALLIIVLLELSSFKPGTVSRWFNKKNTITANETNEVLQVS